MLPGFERLLLGLGTGDDIEELLQPEQAFGTVNQGNFHQFPVAKFEQLLEDELIPTEVGSMVCFKDPKGFDLSGVVTNISDDSIGIDFNHPLAGKQIIFRARIISVIPANIDAVEVKL
jgi:FKBP-type peptidyl-prolyl cis-trans isomerase SlpA